MRVASSLLFVATLSLIAPGISSSLLPRSRICANDGKTKAGSVFQPRNFADSVASRDPHTEYAIPLTWCCPGTATAVTITVFNAYDYNSDGDVRVLDMLIDTLELVQHVLSRDVVIPTGVFTFTAHGVNWYSANANNHQQTYGVLAGAIIALSEFMNAYGAYGYAHFEIFDGGNQVGTGSLGPVRS